MWSNGSVLRRRIDDLWFSAKIVERGDEKEVISLIEYLDDQKTEQNVPISECDQESSSEGISLKEDLPNTLDETSDSREPDNENKMNDDNCINNSINPPPYDNEITSKESSSFQPWNRSILHGDAPEPQTSQQVVDSISDPEQVTTTVSEKKESVNNTEPAIQAPPPSSSSSSTSSSTTTTTSSSSSYLSAALKPVSISTEVSNYVDDKGNSIPIEGVCEICGVLTKFRCARCGVAFFCSREHQREAWGPLKKNMNTISNEKKDKMDVVEANNEDDINDDNDKENNHDTITNVNNSNIKGYHRKHCVELMNGPIKPNKSSNKVQSRIDDFIGPPLPLISNVDGTSLRLNLNKRFSNDDGSGGDLRNDAELMARTQKQFGHLFNSSSSSSSSSSLSTAGAATAANHFSSDRHDASVASAGTVNSNVGKSYDDFDVSKNSSSGFSRLLDVCTTSLNEPPQKRNPQNNLDRHFDDMLSKRDTEGGGGGRGGGTGIEPITVGSPPGTPPATHKSNMNFVNNDFMREAFTTPPRLKRRANDDQDVPRTAPNIGAGSGNDADDEGNNMVTSYNNVSEANVASLIEMGIVASEADAREALGHSHDSVEQAVEWVFSGGLRQLQSSSVPLRPIRVGDVGYQYGLVDCHRPNNRPTATSSPPPPPPYTSSSATREHASAAASHDATGPYLDASMLALHTQESSNGAPPPSEQRYEHRVRGGLVISEDGDNDSNKCNDDVIAHSDNYSDNDAEPCGGGFDNRIEPGKLQEIHSILHGSGDHDLSPPPNISSQTDFPSLPPPGRTTTPEESSLPKVRIDSIDDLITSFEVNVTRGISEGPPWCINLNITAYRVNHLVSSADQQDSAACYDLLLVLTENTPTSSSSPITTVPTCAPTEEEKVCSRSAMIVEGSDVISISRTTFLPRTEAPYNWMDDSNEVDRVREFGEYIDAHQKPGDETRNPSNQYIIKIPSSQRIVTQSASCHLSDDLIECYYNALPVLEAAKFLGSFGENDNNGGGNGLYNLGGGTGGIGSVGISSRFDSTYTVKNYNESVNAMNEFVVDESKVSQLQDMGFDAEMARNALKSNRNDIDAAANHIISLMYA